MSHAKVSETFGQAKAILALAVKQGGNNELGLRVRDPHDLHPTRQTLPTTLLLLDVTRAHSTSYQDDTIIATVRVQRGAILRLAEQIKAEDEQRAAAIAYQRARMDENQAAGLPLLTGTDEDGNFPPRS